LAPKALAAGPHTFKVTAGNAQGSVNVTRSFTVASLPSIAVTPPADGGATKVTPTITSAPKSVKPGKKIKLGVNCPDGCKIAVAFKGFAKRLTGSIVVKPGATSVSYSISKSATKAIRKALKAQKTVTATFMINGGSAKKVTIKD
jgi:hypothetical protein